MADSNARQDRRGKCGAENAIPEFLTTPGAYVFFTGVHTMLRHTLRIGLIVGLLGLFVQDANAFGHRGGCGWGGCGYGYGYAGCGYGGCGFGGCGYAGCGYGYGAYGYGGPGYGGYAATPASGYVPVGSQPFAASVASNARLTPNSLLLKVKVPADAKVFVNDRPTTSKGEERRFTSNGLHYAVPYRYQVRAEFVRDGKPVSEEQTVALSAGEVIAVTFPIDPNAPKVADATATTQR